MSTYQLMMKTSNIHPKYGKVQGRGNKSIRRGNDITNADRFQKLQQHYRRTNLGIPQDKETFISNSPSNRLYAYASEKKPLNIAGIGKLRDYQ